MQRSKEWIKATSQHLTHRVRCRAGVSLYLSFSAGSALAAKYILGPQAAAAFVAERRRTLALPAPPAGTWSVITFAAHPPSQKSQDG